jgi:hypothetical protein
MGFCAEQRLAGLPRARIAACIPGTDRQGKKKNLERPLRAMATLWDATPGRGRRTNAAHSPPCRPQHTKPKWALLTPSNGPGAVPYATCPGQGQQMEVIPGTWWLGAYGLCSNAVLCAGVSKSHLGAPKKARTCARGCGCTWLFVFRCFFFRPLELAAGSWQLAVRSKSGWHGRTVRSQLLEEGPGSKS